MRKEKRSSPQFTNLHAFSLQKHDRKVFCLLCLPSWRKTLATLPETLERTKGMENTWSLWCDRSFSFKLFCVIGTGAKFIMVQECYTEGGSGYLCWKWNAVKVISPDLLVLSLFSETMYFVISTDDDKGLKPKGS